MDWDAYEKRCDEIREENRRYLQVFEEDMSGLSPRTVRDHLFDAEFYINEYLLREDLIPMEEGTFYIDGFLGDFFIRKCGWSTPGGIKRYAASIKKFYKSMAEHGFVKKEAFEELCSVIKENMEEWQEDCEAFNNSSMIGLFDDFLDF